MQKHSEPDMAIIDQEDDYNQELAEVIPTTPSRKHLNLVLLIALILVLIVFTYLGVHTLQHVPPSTSDDDLGAIYNAISTIGII